MKMSESYRGVESANNHIHDVTDMSHIISLKMEKYFSTC